jgi:hypothetical protein
VADLGSSAAALRDVLHPAVRITERPNALNPRGVVRDRDAAIAGFLAGKDLLASQTIDVLELLVSGDRISLRATWRGTIGQAAGPLAPGVELVAHIAAWLTVADGRILERDIGFAIVHVEGKPTTDDVVFAEPGDRVLLGARSLEGLNLRVDPSARSLVDGGPIVAAVVACGTIAERTGERAAV